MITIQTKNKVSKSQADNFNDSQAENGLVRLQPISKEDCKWKLQVKNNKLGKEFEAVVIWFQLQEYETGDTENPVGINPVKIYEEDFKLDAASTQALWEALQGEILSTDNYLEKIQEFTTSMGSSILIIYNK